MSRTAHCGKLRKEDAGQQVVLSGWVQRRRDLGGLIFIDLRDRSGIVQVVFNPEISKDSLEVAEKVRSEYVLEVTGDVVVRDAAAVNLNIPTGEIEVQVTGIEIINASKTPPFQITDDTDVAEEYRLKYRYLDLRRPIMQETFKMRHRVSKQIRDFLDEQEFLEIETPILTKSTPEGARDYLVPSRVHPGEFYALPQSPQLFKQLLMVGGMERYYQIVRCFRDEDLRADRQPEFTQIDIEVSFFELDAFLKMIEEMMVAVVERVKGIKLSQSFATLTYREAMARYGSDKPDTRFGLELIDLSDDVKDSGFKVFTQAVATGGQVKAINVKGEASHYSRKNIDDLTDFVKNYGAKGLAWLKVDDNGLHGPITKFLDEQTSAAIVQKAQADSGDLLLFVADSKKIVAGSLGALRSKLGKELKLIDESKFNFLWITEFPLFAYDEEEGRYVAEHHPFTMPMREDLDKLETNPADVRAEAYDLVLNGYELGSGSQRIYQRDIQEKMFTALGFSQEEARERFGFLLDAFEYGTPPHRGIALGLDRLVMILAGRTNLRETIAFPKTASASCLLTEAPSPVDERQVEDLHLEIKGIVTGK